MEDLKKREQPVTIYNRLESKRQGIIDKQTVFTFRNYCDAMAALKELTEREAALSKTLIDCKEAFGLLGKLIDDKKVKIPYTPEFIKHEGLGIRIDEVLKSLGINTNGDA